MPEPPTPAVNGQVVGSPALQASMSMLSFDPAASTSSLLASIASAGSFCLFCENGVDRFWLPTVTSRSPGAPTAPGTANANAAASTAKNHRLLLITSPFYDAECGRRYLLLYGGGCKLDPRLLQLRDRG